MDAAIFIALITITVTVLSQAQMTDCVDSGTDASETLDTIFESKMSSRDVRLFEDDRIMKISDISALYLLSETKEEFSFITGSLNRIYVWDDAYGLSMEYQGHVWNYRYYDELSGEEVIRTYSVEYGGELNVTLRIYG